MASMAKSSNMISAMGWSPIMAAPMPMPTIDDSAMGVFTTLCRPKRSTSPAEMLLTLSRTSIPR